MRRLPVSTQTVYADLVDRAWTGSFQEIVRAGGAPYVQSANGRDYWYLKMPMVNGHRRKDVYLGPDGPEVRARIDEQKALREILDERKAAVKSLRAARVPGPDPQTGKILAALSEAGAFRLRMVVVGSVAFQTYAPMLGVRFDALAGRTTDLDLAQFHSISVAMGDSMQDDFLTVLRSVDPRFTDIPSPIDGRRTLRYAVRTGSQETFSVDLLSPNRGADGPRVTALPALKADAQLLRYLDFLLYGEVNAVALYGPGIPLNVPAPERFAIHKLIVSRLRISTPESQAKSRKDIVQAEALLDVLLEDRPDEVSDVWNEALGRGPKWRSSLLRSARLLKPEIGERLMGMSEAAVPSNELEGS